MTDRTMIERIASALSSHDLKMRESACDLDKIIASGWSARDRQLGALGFWAKYVMDVEKTRQFLEQVRRLAVAKARERNRGGSRDELHRLAEVVVFWWLADKCPTCDGRGVLVLEGEQITSNYECHVCTGTGIRPLPDPSEANLDWEEAKFERRFAELQVLIDGSVASFVGVAARALRFPNEAEQHERI